MRKTRNTYRKKRKSRQSRKRVRRASRKQRGGNYSYMIPRTATVPYYDQEDAGAGSMGFLSYEDYMKKKEDSKL